jgi:hypothetical protein
MATGVKVRPGDIEFLDLRGGPGTQQIQGLNMNPGIRIEPKPGMMLVFPSWLPHFVHPVTGDTERVAVACNATMTKYTLPPPAETKAEASPTPPKETPEDDPHSQRRP